jgi:hypothetical protein
LPTTGNCEAAVAYQIDKGHYGDVKLDGLRAAGVYKWPGPIHEGGGHMQLIIDERASADQRRALEAILQGEDTDEMATFWFVYTKMCAHRHPTLYAPIELEMNPDDRTGNIKVGGVFETMAEPIPNIVTGAPHRIRINPPNGFEFDVAEMARGSTKVLGGEIKLKGVENSHAHFCRLDLGGHGVVHPAA